TQNTNLPTALTGITDENGARFAIFNYDSSGRAVSTEHAGANDKFSLTYDTPYVQTTVIDPLGNSRVLTFTNLLGTIKNTGLSQPCGHCGVTAQATTYDAN